MSRRSLTRSLTRSLLALTLVSGLSGCGMMTRATYPAPSWQGQSPALGAPVKVYLDALGVPHVFAASDDDAALALGFLHGRDRRFQLELIRLAAEGRLTELLGKDLLDTDRRLRILSYLLDEQEAHLDAVDRRRIDAYCSGINLAWGQTPRPLELKLLGYEPAPWTVHDVLAVARLQSWDLSVDAELEAVRDRLAATVSPKVMSWLLDPPPSFGQSIIGADPRRRPPLPNVPEPPGETALLTADGQPATPPAPAAGDTQGRLEPDGLESRPDGTLTDEARHQLASAVEAWLEAPLGGSNSWVVAGSRTDTGKPMLAGDPHLALRWPAVFYEVHLHTPEVDVSGATFPGMPMVVIGRAAGVAWSLTTSYADAQDLFTLAVDPADPGRYRLDGEMQAFKPWPQTFTWGKKPGESISETFRVSEFGPVYNPGREARLRPGVTYALAWTGFTGETVPVTTAFDRLYRARTPAEVVAAVEMLPTPSQNWAYATADGHIGYVLGGRLPSRRASPLPRDGSTRAAAWSSYLSSLERPKLLDPPSGAVVASNQPILADALQFNGYASGAYRALRIATGLETRKTWTAAQLRGLQIDAVNLEAARIVPNLLDGLEKAPKALEPLPTARQDRARRMAEQLKGWNFRMDSDAVAPLVYESWRGHLHQRLFRSHLKDPALLKDMLKARLSEAPMESALFTEAGRAWWDDPATEAVETREDAVVDALLAAEEELARAFGTDIAGWTWGRAHTLTLDHPFAAKAVLRPLFGQATTPAPGGRHCIFALNHLGVIGDYRVDSGPALRQVVELGGPAGFVIPGGNAGQPGHRFSHNQLDDWWAGRQHVAGGDEAELAKRAVGTIELTPAR